METRQAGVNVPVRGLDAALGSGQGQLPNQNEALKLCLVQARVTTCYTK